MLTLNYRIEKDGIEIVESHRLMLSERQINDLMDNLVERGFTVLEMSVGFDTIASQKKG